jgi:D-alanyl-D-alanine carboxypeptidase
MKNRSVHVLVIIAALAAVVTVLSFTVRSSPGQSPGSKSKSPVKPVVLNTGRSDAPKSNPSSAFTAAAAQNALLRNDVNWTFGGKQQRGWYLYDLLIGKTLKTERESVTDDFAVSLASWQKKRGLSPSGVLDEHSLMAMVSHWQSNRLKNRTSAQPDQLTTAPPSDFYDPARVAELRQVEQRTYAAYKEMVAAAMADPELNVKAADKYFKIISAFRSREYQDELRRKSPNAGSAGLAINSPHFTGRALDIYVGGLPVDTKDSNRAIQVNTPAYQWLVRNAERFGFRPYFYEPWHWEYVK